jgi:hypothetical protein
MLIFFLKCFINFKLLFSCRVRFIETFFNQFIAHDVFGKFAITTYDLNYLIKSNHFILNFLNH